MRVLVAPDKFRGSLTAQEAAHVIAAGWRRFDPSAEIDEAPMADGGEGTLDALVAALGGERVTARVTGPLGDPIDAPFGLLPASGAHAHELAVVEMARASGLVLVPKGRRDPTRTTTRGTGELILGALRAGARRFLVCIGGSGTNDAGAGMAQALGIRLLDGRGRDLPPGGAALLDLASIDPSGLDPRARQAPFVVASDVDNPLTGPQGASAVYGPQKGASPQDVALLDRALARFAETVRRDLGVEVERVPGAGAAGGLGAGLVAFLGAELRPGVEVVMEAVGLRERLAGADVVITGEGTFDAQSLHGKAPSGVLDEAALAGVPAIVLCGRANIRPGGLRVLALTDTVDARTAMRRAGPLLEALAERAAATFQPG